MFWLNAKDSVGHGTVHCILYIANWTLHTAYCTLLTIHFKLNIGHSVLHTTHYTLQTVHCTLYKTLCRLQKCILYTAQNTLHTIQYQLHTVHWAHSSLQTINYPTQHHTHTAKQTQNSTQCIWSKACFDAHGPQAGPDDAIPRTVYCSCQNSQDRW